MKVAISCSKFGVSGGMERYAYELIYGLYNLGISPTVITRKVEKNLAHIDAFNIIKINVRFIPGKLRDLYFSWRVNQYCKTHQIDLLIGCSRIRSPDIMICGGTHIGFLHAMNKTAKISDKLHIKLERAQCNNAKYIVAHSQLMCDELVTYYQVKSDKIKLIYPPADNIKFKTISHQERHKLREEFGFKNDKFYFLFPSGSHLRKGLPFLQKFFAETDLPIELVILGKPVTGHNIKTLPWTNEIEKLYQAADATILASEYEPFGLVGIESVLCGTPIVFAENIGACEVISAPAKQSFILNDDKSLQNAIENIIHFDRKAFPDLSQSISYDVSVKHHIQQIMNLVS
ncbi:glycosyltransferase family 4 protein [Utexia brackfieldae]|uniref:glycosyltransferase family 4 protein n=1 Tax=Utexia brackfieldae TaxID=3074108 RepID=UPI00370D2329